MFNFISELFNPSDLIERSPLTGFECITDNLKINSNTNKGSIRNRVLKSYNIVTLNQDSDTVVKEQNVGETQILDFWKTANEEFLQDTKEEKVVVRQAGVDYPSVLVDEDGYHIFTWNGEVMVVPSETLSKEDIDKIMSLSFDMFKANIEFLKQVAENIQKELAEKMKAEEEVKEQGVKVETVEEPVQDASTVERLQDLEAATASLSEHKPIGQDTLKAAAAEDRLYEEEEKREFKFNRVKRRR